MCQCTYSRKHPWHCRWRRPPRRRPSVHCLPTFSSDSSQIYSELAGHPTELRTLRNSISTPSASRQRVLGQLTVHGRSSLYSGSCAAGRPGRAAVLGVTGEARYQEIPDDNISSGKYHDTGVSHGISWSGPVLDEIFGDGQWPLPPNRGERRWREYR